MESKEIIFKVLDDMEKTFNSTLDVAKMNDIKPTIILLEGKISAVREARKRIAGKFERRRND